MAAIEEAVLAAEGEAAVEEAEHVDDFDHIDKLQQLGISAADIKKAKDANFFTIQSFIMHPKKVLVNIKGLSDAKVDKMVEAAKKLCPAASWRTGAAVAAERARDIVRITTGSKQLDDLLGGGMETKAITEMHGEYRTGKTQLCLTMCVTCQMPENMGGGAGKVAFVDTEGTFRPERITAIAERYQLDPTAVLDNIIVARAHNHEHQMDLLLSIAALMVDDPFKLLIVDSLTSNFRNDFCGRGELADRQQKLGQMLSRLKKISEEFNVAVVVTNHVVSDPGGGAMFVSDPKKAVGGHVLAHACTTRLSLRKGKAEQRLCKVVESPCLAEGEVSFQVGPGGIEDYKD
ncbi:Rad51-like protein [Haematococcus lacustris]